MLGGNKVYNSGQFAGNIKEISQCMQNMSRATGKVLFVCRDFSQQRLVDTQASQATNINHSSKLQTVALLCRLCVFQLSVLSIICRKTS